MFAIDRLDVGMLMSYTLTYSLFRLRMLQNCVWQTKMLFFFVSEMRHTDVAQYLRVYSAAHAIICSTYVIIIEP